MRPIAVLLMVATVSLAASVIDSDTQEWESYKIKHGKSYESPEEDLKRRELYFQRKGEIEAHNELYRQGLASYEKGLSEFTDLTDDEMDMLKGFRMDMMPDEPIDSSHIYEPTGNTLPPWVDWRQKNAVTPVKNQRKCGSCWAFSAVGSMEGQHALKTGELVSLSEQQLVDCDGVEHGCNSGNHYRAFAYATQWGMESEAEYPYDHRLHWCHFESDQVVARFSGYKKIAKGDEAALQDAVANVGPISVSIHSTPLHGYKNDTIDVDDCTAKHHNHAVLIVGYGEDSGKPYWLVKNSWGESWGDKGYFRIARGKNMCGIAQHASFPVV